MDGELLGRRLAVLAVVAALVVSAAALAPPIRVEVGPPPGSVRTVGGTPGAPAYDAPALAPEPAEAVALEHGAPGQGRNGTLLIDRAHGNRISPEALRPLVRSVVSAGYRVEYLEPNDQMGVALGRADAFLVVDPGTRYSRFEASQVESFVDGGGRLVMLGEPTRSVANTTDPESVRRLPNRLVSLSSRFGIAFGTEYLFNMRANAGNYRNVLASGTEESIARRVDRAVLYTATRVTVENATPVLRTVAGTRTSGSELAARYPVAARRGNVLAVGDASFVSGEAYAVADNDALVFVVARFLVSGNRERALRDYPALVGRAPTVRYTAPSLLDPARRLSGDLRAAGRDPRTVLDRRITPGVRTDVLVTTFEYLRAHPLPASGVRVEGTSVRVDNRRGTSRGAFVVHAPRGEIDLVVVADTPARVRQAVDVITGPDPTNLAITERTIALGLAGGNRSEA